VERRITSPLLEVDSVEKIMKIDQHIGCAMSGLMADSRTMIDHARVESQVSLLFFIIDFINDRLA
jgi:20S proteasome subunit alpha 5